MSQPQLDNYRWAAIGQGRAAWRRFGRIDLEDAEGAALLALAECPRTFDAARWGGWDSKKCQGIFGNYVKRAAWNAAKRACLHEEDIKTEALDPERAEDTGDGEREERLMRWAAGDPEKLSAVQALLAGVSPVGAHSRCRMLTSSAAAKSLRMADRRLRDLCDRGVLAAHRGDGTWHVPVSEVSQYRRRRLVRALEAGATYRAAQKAGRCSLRTVHRAASSVNCQRRQGRPTLHDHELLLSMLSDPSSHPQVWKDGRPVLRRVALAAGCDEKQVRRLAARCI
jgi:hypothetical protein